ncbi:BBSome-interacting protein 1 isoform X1 [Phasianus colchicus]|uniref:BBSome interacting protein 1 n=3 Tax=Phasianus colchicus TaxID=9054 RepID=A0A669PS69_PHACC|nr:BBSome-interacting protein 1 isoform X1 [Phasianus colchicus]
MHCARARRMPGFAAFWAARRMRVRLEGAMPEGKGAFREVLPKQGQLSVEDAAGMVLCKPKVLPLKSVSLEKLEQLQRAAMEASRPPEGTAGPQPQP